MLYLPIDRIPKILLGDPDKAGPDEDGHRHSVVQLEHHIVNGQVVSF